MVWFSEDETRVSRALAFATEAHKGQVRKYTGEPYINHPIAVAKLVESVTDNKDMIAAALLHDTVEDTDATIEDIQKEFGCYIRIFVEYLTDISKPEDGNRAYRKMLDRNHISKALPPAKTIKLADLIDNSRSIVQYDPDFAVVYMREKELLLDVLKDGDPTLYKIASDIVKKYHENKLQEKLKRMNYEAS